MSDDRTWDASRVHKPSRAEFQPGVARCAMCGRDVSDLADSDGRRDELGPAIVYWCLQCAAPQVRRGPFGAGYLLVRDLGSGLHVTWQMWDPATGRALAVRRIAFWTRREENIRRYVEESQPFLGLAHPHLTRLVDVRASASAVQVASAYVPGGNLWDWVAERGPASPPLAALAVRGLLDGLRQLHGLGVAHGNIHPWNVLLPEGNPQRAQLCMAGRAFPGLLDTFDPESDPPPPTVRDRVALVFAGPGGFIGLREVSPAADLYAMGQVLYLLLTGELALELPWRSSAEPDIGQWVAILRNGEPVAARARRPDLPAALAEVVDRAVARDPAGRFQQAEEFASALDAVGDLHLGTGVTQPAPFRAAVVPQVPSTAGAPAPGPGEDATPLEWQVGDTILDLYEVKDVFTSGGMGPVYRVHHRAWDVDLAVRCPRPESSHSQAQRQDLVREAEAWVSLGLHPHIVTCHYLRTLGGIPRIFAEFVEGGSLQDWIRDRRLYEGTIGQALQRILDVATQFAWGLAYAHERGLVHQDVKPANVLMTAAGIAKVTDFCLAAWRAAGCQPGDASAGGSDALSSGTALAYTSPEQAAGESLARGTDVWRWGLSVLEMFSGRVTWFSGQAAPAILEMLLQEGPAVDGPPPMPAVVADLLRRCFQQDPSARANMAEVVAQLVETYRQEAGQEYPRRLPGPTELQAGSLNNRALSLLDLGHQVEAQAVWRQALAEGPYQTEATYNLGLYRWRAAQITDLDLVRQLEAAARSQPGTWLPRYLLGRVHLQRGDLEAARAALEAAARLPPGAPEVQAALARLNGAPSVCCLRAFEGHAQPVQALALSPDGRCAVTGASDSTLRVWDLESVACLRTLTGHAGPILGLAITPDGQRAVSAGLDGTLRLWDLAGGECLRTLEQHGTPTSTETPQGSRAVAVTPDGRLAVSGGYDHALCLWDLAGGELVRTLEGHAGLAHTVAVMPDGGRALSAGEDGALRLWDLAGGECLRTLEGHAGAVNSLAVVRNGSLAVSGGDDRTLRVWDLVGGACLRVMQGHRGTVRSVAISADGHLAISGSSDGTVRVWDLAGGVCLRTLEGHAGEVSAVAIFPDGQRAISAAEDKTLRVWQLAAISIDLPWVLSRPAEAGEVRAAQVGKDLEAARVALDAGRAAEAGRALERALRVPGFEQDRTVLELWHAAGCRGGRRKGLRLAPRRLRALEGHTGEVLTVAFTPDGLLAISGSSDRTLRIWDLPSGKCLHSLQGHTGMVSTVAVTPDGRWAVSGSDDKTLRVWDLSSGECLRTLEGHNGHVQSVAAIPGGDLAVSVANRDTLRVWDLTNGECLHALRLPADTSLWSDRCMSITPDGRWAVMAPYLSGIRAYDLAGGKHSRTVKMQAGLGALFAEQVIAITDGRRAVSEGMGHALRVWDLASGACLNTLRGHSGLVLGVALTMDGLWAISGSHDDLTLRVWDLASGACLSTVERQGATSPRPVALSPDGHYLLTGEYAAIGQWVLDWDYLFPEPVDWDEGARPHLESFVALHTSAPSRPFQRPRPAWAEADFQQLLAELALRGYGWLRPEGVRHKLEEMARERR